VQPVPNAPAGTLRLLALDEAIEVAAVLEQAEGLPEATLLERRRQEPRALPAISRRSSVRSRVTDVRGGSRQYEVVRTAAGMQARVLDAGVAAFHSRGERPELACVCGRAPISQENAFCGWWRARRAKYRQACRERRFEGGAVRRPSWRKLPSVSATPSDTIPGSMAALSPVEDLNRAGKLDEARLKLFAGKTRLMRPRRPVAEVRFANCAVERALRTNAPTAPGLRKSRGAELGHDAAILLMLKLGDINVQRDLFARLQSKTAKTALQSTAW